MSDLTEFAPAKINLHLHVVGRRADGYHLLDSLVVFAGAGDRLTVSPSSELSLRLTGLFAAGLEAEADNLVLRAARALADLTGIRPKGALVLEKNLPVASGIGGGSADAAAALRLLSRAWGVAPSAADLMRIGQRLGADVPVCITSRPAMMGGIGEILTPAPALPSCGLVLLNPDVAISTPSVFQTRSQAFSAPACLPAEGWLSAEALVESLRATRNDLEPPARALAPSIGDCLDALASAPGCLLARMSGSGATCFGLFASALAAQQAAGALARPGWWAWGGGLHPTRDAT